MEHSGLLGFGSLLLFFPDQVSFQPLFLQVYLLSPPPCFCDLHNANHSLLMLFHRYLIFPYYFLFFFLILFSLSESHCSVFEFIPFSILSACLLNLSSVIIFFSSVICSVLSYVFYFFVEILIFFMHYSPELCEKF